MKINKNLIMLLACYVLWGFQPLYWALGKSRINSYTMLAVRIVMAALFSLALLALTGRLGELWDVFRNRDIMKLLVPATVFLLLDWAVFLVAVNSGHVLDASLGYYINPLMLFAIGVLFYREKCGKYAYAALITAVVGVIVSILAFGSFPYISLIIAVNWSVYAAIKKNVTIDGVLSIAAETALLTPLAIAFLLLFKRSDLAALAGRDVLFLLGSGAVTAIPMYLYSNCASRFSVTFMCFAQYLSPSFNMLCGLLMGESFSPSQTVSLIFFIIAIIIFTVGEQRREKNA